MLLHTRSICRQRTRPVIRHLAVCNLSVFFKRKPKRLSRRVESIVAVDNLSTDFYAGHLNILLGESGGGKSVLVQTLLHQLPPNTFVSGEVLVNQHRRLSFGDFATEFCPAIIPQSFQVLDPLLKVGDYLLLLAQGWYPDRTGSDRRGMVQQALAALDLPAHIWDCFPHQLSGGMYKRVLIAVASLNPSEVLLADEPTTGLDDSVSDIVWEYLSEQKNRRLCIVVTHDLRRSIRFGDRIYALRDGRVVDFFARGGNLSHAPYLKSLWDALPENAFFEDGE